MEIRNRDLKHQEILTNKALIFIVKRRGTMMVKDKNKN